MSSDWDEPVEEAKIERLAARSLRQIKHASCCGQDRCKTNVQTAGARTDALLGGVETG